MNTRKLAIEEPCNQSWSGMTSQENGRHCAKCEKTVVDFTEMSGLSILQFLDGAHGEVCGRIRPSQMTISVPRLVSYQQPEFSLSALVLGLALTTFCALQSCAQEQPVKGNMVIEQVKHNREKQRETTPTQYSVFVQREDSSPVDSATVTVSFEDGTSVSYFSDSLGICRFTTDKAFVGIEVMQDSRWRSRIYMLSDFDATNKLIATVEDFDPPIMGKMIRRDVWSGE